jgi:nucleotide-binding universal stress UspA family protein
MRIKAANTAAGHHRECTREISREDAMDIKQILLVQSAEFESEAAQVAARLARAHGATVAGLCLFCEPDPAPADTYAIGPEAVGDVLEHRRRTVNVLTAPAEATFQKALADRGFSDGWEVGEVNEWRDVVIDRARFVDLVVMAAPGAMVSSYRGVAETLALRSGSPSLLVPANASPKADFKRVVLAWNGSREAKRAMDDGLLFLKAAAETAVVVAKEESTRSVDRAQTDALTRHLARHGVHAQVISSEVRGRGAGDVLIEQCAAFGADLLIMGAFGHSRAAELILGGATRTALTRAMIPTLLSH